MRTWNAMLQVQFTTITYKRIGLCRENTDRIAIYNFLDKNPSHFPSSYYFVFGDIDAPFVLPWTIVDWMSGGKTNPSMIYSFDDRLALVCLAC